MVPDAATGIWYRIGRQLADPHGAGGRLVGRAMRIANIAPTRATIDALGVQPDDVVLDLGCGPGAGIAILARRASHVMGLDRSATMIDAAARLNRRAIAAGKVTLTTGLFDALPYPDNSIDAVLAANVTYFWADVPRVIGEIRRVLRPGGRLVLYVTDARTMARWKFASAETHRHFDEHDLRAALLEAGVARDFLTINRVAFTGRVTGLIALIIPKDPDR